MADTEETRQTVKSVERAFDIVDVVRESDGARQVDIAQELSLANSTVHKHLNTLTNEGVLVRENGEFRLGLELLHLGGLARDRSKANRASKSVVEDLAEKSGEQSQFIVEEHGRGFHVHTSPSEQGRQIDTRVGKRIYLHANSSGKAILAHTPEERVDRILDRWGLPAITEHTITDRDEFKDELERTRERGFAINDEEHILGWGGIAAPVRSPTGTILGAVAIGGPTKRYEGDIETESDFPTLVLEAANQLELRVQYD